MNSQRFVYFVRPIGAEGPIKIGCSYLPAERLKTLMTWAPVPLELIFQTPGDLKLEQNIHECFADAHSHHEWFNPTPALLTAIDRLRRGIPVADAIDLSKRVGHIRAGRGAHKRIPAVARCFSYQLRLSAASRRADKATLGLFYFSLPADAYEALQRWRDTCRHHVPQEPRPEMIARFDALIADPLRLMVPRERYIDTRTKLGVEPHRAAA